jgi:hypothetical protein
MANTYKALSTVTVGAGGAASISFTNIPQTYTDLVLKFSTRDGRTGIAVSDIRFNFNGTGVGTNISGRYMYGNGTSATSVTISSSGELAFGTAAGATASTFGNAEVYIPNYIAGVNKSVSSDSVAETNATGGYQLLLAGLWSNTAPITSIEMTPFTSPFAQYSTATLYGVFNADVSSAPATPTIGTATAGAGYVDVTFTGVSNAASYTMTSSTGGITATGTKSPIRIPVGAGGLTGGTSYTFTVKSNNPFGSSAASAASNSVTAVNTTILAMPQGSSTTGRYSQNAGVTWSNFTMPVASTAQALGAGANITYGNGYFVYTPYGQNNAYYSTTGFSSWTSAALPYTNFQATINLYTPGNGFLCFSMYDSQRSVKSTNGTSWSAGPTQTQITVGWSQGYVAAAGRWYASAHSDPYGSYTSSWAGTYTSNASFSGSPYFWSSGVAASNGTTALHTANYDTGTQLWYTTTGTSVTLGTLPSTVQVGSQIYGSEAGTYLALGSGTVAITSTNGTSWTTRTKPSSVGTSYPVYSKDTGFVAIPYQSTTANTAYSADGITWTTGGVLGILGYIQAAGQVLNYSQTTV